MGCDVAVGVVLKRLKLFELFWTSLEILAISNGSRAR